MNSRAHLDEAEDCLNRSWEKWGEDNHREIGAFASRAHMALARVIKAGGRKYIPSKELLEEAEDLLRPGRASGAYGVGRTLDGMRAAETYALLAEQKLANKR